MKKFLKYATLILLLFVSFSCVLTGCDKKKDGDYDAPGATDRVIGNGGLAVTKGEYLYFLNGYRSYNDVTKNSDNNKLSNHENVVRGAIYRTKLNQTGDLTLDEDGNIVEGSVERVVDQIACFENGGLYIVGEYLYYATPNTQDDNQGNLLNNYVDYCRVKLSNPSDRKVLYTSEGSVSDGEWAVYEMDNAIYMVINTGSKVVCIKNGDSKNVTTMIDSFGSVQFWDNEDGHELKDYEKYVYYTRSTTDKDGVSGGNVLARVKLGSDDENILSRDGSTSITLKDLKNGRIYYTTSDNKLRVATPTFSKVIGDTALTQKSYDNMYVIDNQDDTATLNRVLVYETGASKESDSTAGRLIYFDNGSWDAVIVKESISMEILDVVGNYVYYYKDSAIYRLDILSGVETKLINGENTFNFSTSQTMNFDVDVNYMYFLNGYSVDDSTVYYLERVYLGDPSTHTFVGKFVDSEKPVETEDEDDTKDTENNLVD